MTFLCIHNIAVSRLILIAVKREVVVNQGICGPLRGPILSHWHC